MTLTPSLHALLHELIDYAGLFPPARLPLDAALANYARYVAEPDRWMLARFVLPAARLAELDEAHLAPFSAERPLRLSLLAAAHADGAAIEEASAAWGGRLVADAIESRVDESDITARLDADQRALAAHGLDAMIFYELPFDSSWGERLPAAIAALAAAREGGARVGFKLRCGGEVAAAFPTAAQLAGAQRRCRDAGLPMKFTAGLHHPLPRTDEATGATMHGFLNVFVAGMAAHVHALDAATHEAILAERDPAAFAFDDQGLHWRRLAIPTPTIASLRQGAFLSYGSCSFDEPRDDLRALDLLPE